MNEIFTSIFIYVMQFHFWIESTTFSGNSVIEIMRQGAFVTGCVCIWFKWVSNGKIAGAKLILFLLTSGIIIGGMLVSGGLTVVKLLMFALAMKDISYEYVVKSMLHVNIIIATFIWGAVLLGFIPNEIMYDNGEALYCLGFTNPNTAAMLFFTILVSLTCTRIGKWKVSDYALCIFTSYAMYSLTGSRSMLLSDLIYILFSALEQYGNIMKKIVQIKVGRQLLYVMFPVFTAASYIFAKAYSTSNIIKKLNLLFSWRFYLWNKYVANINIGLLGRNFDWDNLGTLDNGYLVLLFRYGLLVYLIYFMIFTCAIYIAIKRKKYNILILVLTNYAYCFVEGYNIIVNINFVLIYSLSCFWEFPPTVGED